jgi:hypothetical protein
MAIRSRRGIADDEAKIAHRSHGSAHHGLRRECAH